MIWPAGLLTTAALAAACVVVGDHVVEAGDGCLGSERFIATPASVPTEPLAADLDGKPLPVKADLGRPARVGRVEQPGTVPPTAVVQISGCLDVALIENPRPSPVPDGRA